MADVKQAFQEVLLALGRVIADERAAGRQVCLVGIRRGGDVLARALATALGDAALRVGAVDIALYRDDLESGGVPRLLGSDIPFSLDGMAVIVVDDVLYTGRTVHAAMHVLAEHGRAAVVRLAVLVDRGGRELPIAPDVCGVRMDVGGEERVRVRFDTNGVPAALEHVAAPR